MQENKYKKCRDCGSLKKIECFYSYVYKKGKNIGQRNTKSYCKSCWCDRVKAIKQAEFGKGRMDPIPELCQCCGGKETHSGPNGVGRSLSFDHCHKTGRFRGWLCAGCNLSIGHARDSVEVLEKMIIYLKSFESSLFNASEA